VTMIVTVGHVHARTPRMTARTPDSKVDIHRCFNRLGGAGLSIAAVSHKG
jgi:hypothetical protein